jgi:hypothetical protein
MILRCSGSDQRLAVDPRDKDSGASVLTRKLAHCRARKSFHRRPHRGLAKGAPYVDSRTPMGAIQTAVRELSLRYGNCQLRVLRKLAAKRRNGSKGEVATH